MPVLDFKELSSSRSGSPAGEDLEGLVRELGKRLGLNPEWAGRGADQGRDLFFVEHRRGPLGSRGMRWLVSCKDFANSGRSVSETDAGSVSDKVAQHRADGFLLATTTTASAGLKAMLDGIHAKGEVETRVWDRHELENLLLQDAHIDLVKRYLPESYSAFRRLNNLPLALESLEALVPGPVHKRIREVIETYQVEGSWLTGERIWPYDRASANTIDLAVAALLEQGDAAQAAKLLSGEEIEFDAFEVTLKTLGSFKPAQTQELCREIVRLQDASGPSLYAYRFYVDHYEPSNEDQIALAVSLSSEDLFELYADEIITFIEDDLVADPAKYRAWGDLDALSSHTTLEEAYAYDVRVTASADKSRIEFRTAVTISVLLCYDREGPDSTSSFSGVVEGHIDAAGIFVQDVTVDTRSFYE
ncbi:restriction endonuclease [Bosea sp. (in: a-proteobacteria)]|uniref:restriction endonuclease n=1 Tax=Bosea sp. (in: a-proteobacteria) TaxID=1871050 RepID=UPI001ACA892E|nr:restriction endonuclease [Bosea sp. (in: a-proteobacteria)]MBN9436948.1 hypothetical protein [Bosea sp. (in: a-proteobacteria)]